MPKVPRKLTDLKPEQLRQQLAKKPAAARKPSGVVQAEGLELTLVLAGVRPDMLTVLNNVGFQSWFTAEHVFPEEDEDYSATLKAVRYAHNKLAELKLPFTGPPELAVHTDLYYLV